VHTLEAVGGDGLGVAVRLARFPNRRQAWCWVHVVEPHAGGPVVVRDHDVPLPRQGWEVRAEGLWCELVCEVPLDHWSYGVEAFGVALETAADALGAEVGERVPVGLDLEWEAAAPARTRPTGHGGGYAQPGIVHGEVLVARRRWAFDGVGERRHAWGAPAEEPSGWSAWGRSGGGTWWTVVAPAGGMVDGWYGDDRVVSATTLPEVGADGLVAAARHELHLGDGSSVTVPVTVTGRAPVAVGGATLDRAVCRYGEPEPPGGGGVPGDGVPGGGWSSWWGRD
jgi:hypothetical protein